MTRAEYEALALWRKREMMFPPRVRRMTPDAFDRASGAWQRVVECARAAAALRARAQEASDDQ